MRKEWEEEIAAPAALPVKRGPRLAASMVQCARRLAHKSAQGQVLHPALSEFPPVLAYWSSERPLLLAGRCVSPHRARAPGWRPAREAPKERDPAARLWLPGEWLRHAYHR